MYEMHVYCAEDVWTMRIPFDSWACSLPSISALHRSQIVMAVHVMPDRRLPSDGLNDDDAKIPSLEEAHPHLQQEVEVSWTRSLIKIEAGSELQMPQPDCAVCRRSEQQTAIVTEVYAKYGARMPMKLCHAMFL